MVSVKQTKQLLVIIIAALLVASVAIKIGGGVAPQAAVLDTLMSGLQMDYIGFSTTAAAHWTVLTAKVLDAAVLPLLAILIATLFVEALDSFNLKERIARGRIRGMRGHVIIVPFNGYGRELAQRLGEQGIRTVVLAKTRKGLAEATELGLMGVIGDIDDPDSFVAAGIGRAAYVVACDWDDMRNAIVAITARSGAPGVKVVAVVNDPEDEDKMRILKVDALVTPELAAGKEIADRIIKNVFSRPIVK
jgi:voltage-gated potassium channel Kch